MSRFWEAPGLCGAPCSSHTTPLPQMVGVSRTTAWALGTVAVSARLALPLVYPQVRCHRPRGVKARDANAGSTLKLVATPQREATMQTLQRLTLLLSWVCSWRYVSDTVPLTLLAHPFGTACRGLKLLLDWWSEYWVGCTVPGPWWGAAGAGAGGARRGGDAAHSHTTACGAQPAQHRADSSRATVLIIQR